MRAAPSSSAGVASSILAPGSSKNHAPKAAAGISMMPAMRGVATASNESNSTGRAKSAAGTSPSALPSPLKRCISANQTQNPPQTTVSSDAIQLRMLSGMTILGFPYRGLRNIQEYMGIV